MLLMTGVAQQTQDEHSDDTKMSSKSDLFSASDCSSATPSSSDCFNLPAENKSGAVLSIDDILSAQAYPDPFLPPDDLSLETVPSLGFPANVPDNIPEHMDMTKQRHGEAGLMKSETFTFNQTEALLMTDMSLMSFDIAPPDLVDEL